MRDSYRGHRLSPIESMSMMFDDVSIDDRVFESIVANHKSCFKNTHEPLMFIVTAPIKEVLYGVHRIPFTQ